MIQGYEYILQQDVQFQPIKKKHKQTHDPSLVADLCRRHGDADRSIELLGLRRPGLRLPGHRNACSGASSSCCSGEHQLPPAAIAGLLLGLIIQLRLLPLAGCRPGWVENHLPPPGGRRSRRAVRQACTAEEGGCHGDWSHLCWALGVNCFFSGSGQISPCWMVGVDKLRLWEVLRRREDQWRGFTYSLSYPKVGLSQCMIAMCCALSKCESSGGKTKVGCLGGEKTDPRQS